jgi:16S rRNA (cytosine1402-N4)-methyltransferase
VNTFTAKDLADIFYRYGEEHRSRRVARFIEEKRKEKPVETTGELAAIVLKAIPRDKRKGGIHPATKVFQGLRIFINGELDDIQKVMGDLPTITQPGCRIMAMSFHSLEDRIVKESFRRWSKGCLCGEEYPHCRCSGEAVVSLVTKKPVVPGEEEIARNNRSRSARLRVCDRI